MVGHLSNMAVRFFQVALCLILLGCSRTISFVDRNVEEWPGKIFTIFDKYQVQAHFPSGGWEGNFTRTNLSKGEVGDSSSLIYLDYDYRAGSYSLPATSLSMGVYNDRDGDGGIGGENIVSSRMMLINNRKWTLSEFNHDQSFGLRYETVLEGNYIFFTVLGIDKVGHGYKRESKFSEERFDMFSHVVENISIDILE